MKEMLVTRQMACRLRYRPCHTSKAGAIIRVQSYMHKHCHPSSSLCFTCNPTPPHHTTTPVQATFYTMLRYSTTLLRETATVRRWVKSRGFGFLTRENETQDVFVHHSALGNGVCRVLHGVLVKTLTSGFTCYVISKNDKQVPLV